MIILPHRVARVQSENDVRQGLFRVDHDKVQETRTTADISDSANTAPGTASQA